MNSRMLLQNLALLVLGVLTGISSPAPAESRRGVIEKQRRWMRSEITVCIATPTTQIASLLDENREALDWKFRDMLANQKEWSASAHQILQKAIQREYRRENGLQFVGFKPCPDRVTVFEMDVVVVPVELAVADEETGRTHYPVTGVADIGPPFHRPALLMLAHGRNENAELEKFMFESVAIHEFGHLAGLRHEHVSRPGKNKDQAKLDPLCSALMSSRNLGEELVDFDSRLQGTEVTTFDRSSIMSYCMLHLAEENSNRIRERVTLRSVSHHLGIESSLALNSRSLLSHGHMKDPRNVRVTLKELDADAIQVDYELLPKLSSGDVHALRCLYGVETGERCEQVPVESVRGLPGISSQGRFVVGLSKKAMQSLRASEVRLRKTRDKPVMVFFEGKARMLPESALGRMRLKPHCMFSGELKKASFRRVFPAEKKDSEWGEKLGGIDLLARYGDFTCSSDLENGELWISDGTLKRIFGNLLK